MLKRILAWFREPELDPNTPHPWTGRPIGDHGKPIDALEYAGRYVRQEEVKQFIYDWTHGHLDEWPEYYQWLRDEGR